MAVTRRQITTAVSGLYLLGLTVVAAYVLQQINRFSIPIPNILTALTVALPPLVGIAVSSLNAFDEHLSTKSRVPTSQIQHTIILVFTVYEAIIATLAGVHLSPQTNLRCGLQDKWRALYMAKDTAALKTIQNALRCCGFESMKDMAWPFPDKTHKADACMIRYAGERDRSCLGPWRSRERSMAGLLMFVAVGIFLWKMAIFYFPRPSSPWSAPSTEGRVRLPIEGGNEPGREHHHHKRPSIGYLDDPDSRNDDDSLAGEVERLNSESSMSSRVEGSRIHPSQIWHNDNQWTREQARI
ncbi:hypothetical protein K431DRAFT_241534 [Polychaeton citri CBS 116435]|uniref:Tetraspanin Tsp3 n=1 Tax=Polychaeton citri CBS 116435 TaxID=1314669 RepID=A0A9P4QCP6_9PEZI|nr:hypothetical protein K431DRAFT_241534 [Polychaeton citri CBS 116435]